MLEEWRLNTDAAEYKQNINANIYKPSEKNKLNRHDSENYWQTSIKRTIQWFSFITTMEHTARIMGEKGLISSLLKVFAIFELRFNYKESKLDVVSLRCIKCKKIDLFLKINSLLFDEMITKFELNTILHNVGMSWIISFNKKMRYEMNKINHQDWLNKGP